MNIWFGTRPLRWTKPTRSAAVAALLVPVLASCSDDSHPGVPESTSPTALTSAELTSLTSPEGHFVTNDPARLAEAVRALKNDNELLVWVKDANTAPRSAETFLSFGFDEPIVVGLPSRAPQQQARTDLLPAHAAVEAHEAVLQTLAHFDTQPYKQRHVLPVYAIRVPDAALEPVLSALLRHPNLDWIEANRRHMARPLAGPVGQNPADQKHYVHNVDDAWAFTRGQGAKVGILDSGFAADQVSSAWHPDGLELIGGGILKKGFVDDGGCGSSNQQDGYCRATDDHFAITPEGFLYGGHGTAMAGLVGGNDNALGGVGIMPQGRTYSMKISFNSYVDGRHCGFWPGNEHEYCIESDDFVYAIDWAISAGLDVLSMSFTGSFGSSVHSALSSAYNQHDILLLAALGNEAGDSPDLVRRDYVMGVAGVLADGTYDHTVNLQYWDVSGLTSGFTTRAHCPSRNQYCTLDYSNLYRYSGGTSSATAIVAGIAGLLRAHEPGLSASATRNRLIQTAHGSTRVVDALAAIDYRPPLTVGISGPNGVAAGTHTWEAQPSGGTGSYTYQWYRRVVFADGYRGPWQTLGTAKKQSLTLASHDSDFELRVDVTSGVQNGSHLLFVAGPCRDFICPESVTPGTPAARGQK